MTVIQLWTKNRGLAHMIARDYYIPGADRDDVTQEALIGLWIAARDYDPDKGSFKTFARVVIHRRLTSCLNAATTHRALALTDAARDQDLPHLHQVSDRVEEREELADLLSRIDSELSVFERHCVIGIAFGVSYFELGEYRRVDNALMRARRKLRVAA
jgi:RNA polymerase sporulation-specific sigma factor